MFKIVFAVHLIISQLTASSGAYLNVNLVVDYFKCKNLNLGYILDCLPANGKVQLTKFLMRHDLRVSEINFKQPNIPFIINNDSNFNHVGIIADGDCSNLEDLIENPEAYTIFKDTFHWLITAANDSIFAKCRNLPLNINSDVYVATPHLNNQRQISSWMIYDVYNPAYKHGGDLKIKHIGFYSETDAYQLNLKGYKYWARRNMTGVTLKTMAVTQRGFKSNVDEYFEYNTENRRRDPFVRVQYKLTQHCQQLYNFSLILTETDTWGYQHKKGKFDGIVGALEKKEIDFGCSALYPKPERIPIMDFAVGVWEFKEIFVFRQPQDRSFGQIFLQPMATSTWLTTLAVALLILVSLRLCQRCEDNVIKRIHLPMEQTWSTLILFTLGAFCQQGSPNSPILTGGRIVTISILLFCFLLYQFYSGTIVSFLLTKPPGRIRSPQDLLASSLKVGSEDAPYNKDFFETTKNPIAIQLYREKILPGKPGKSTGNFYKLEEGLKLVENGGFSYQVEMTAGYIFIRDTFSDEAICELGEVQIFPTKLLMTAIQKGSPFRDLFNYCMLRLAEHGMGNYQKEHWGARKPACLESAKSLRIEVDLNQIYPAILLLLVGVLASLIILGIEVLVKPNNEPIGQGKIFSKYPFRN